MISPDGKFLAYVSNESGESEIYVQPFPDLRSGRREKVSTNGGTSPLWSPESNELFYRNQGFVMAVTLETEPALNPGKPRILFEDNYAADEISDAQRNFMWDIHPDGTRFIMIKPPVESDEESSEGSAAAGPRKINIILNWFEELKIRVPVP